MPGADVAGIDLVVGEVLVPEHAVLVADQAVLGDLRRVELDLDLHVAGNGQQGRLHFLDQHLARFLQGVDVGVVAVADVGQALGHRIVVVAIAEAERAQCDARLALVADQGFQRLLVGGADVEVAVGGEDDPVHAIFGERLFGHRIGQLDAFAAVCAAAGLQLFQRGQDLAVAVARRGRQHQSCRTGIDDDRDAVLRAQLRHQLGEGLLEQGQLVGLVHRAGGIDQEHQVRRRQGGLGHVVTLDPDHQQLALRIPRRRREFGADPERGRARGRRGMAVAEVIDEFLGTHRIRRRTHALAQHAAHVGVAAGIDVDGERGHRLFAGAMHRVVLAMLVLLGVLVLPVAAGEGFGPGRRPHDPHRHVGLLGHRRRSDHAAVQRGRRFHRWRWRGRRGDGVRRAIVLGRGFGGGRGAAGGQGQGAEQGGAEATALHGGTPVVDARMNAPARRTGLKLRRGSPAAVPRSCRGSPSARLRGPSPTA